MSATHDHDRTTASASTLCLAFELGGNSWRLAFSPVGCIAATHPLDAVLRNSAPDRTASAPRARCITETHPMELVPPRS